MRQRRGERGEDGDGESERDGGESERGGESGSEAEEGGERGRDGFIDAVPIVKDRKLRERFSLL